MFGQFRKQLLSLVGSNPTNPAVWWLKFGRIDRLEGAKLDVSVEISQISDAPGLDGVVNILLFLAE